MILLSYTAEITFPFLWGVRANLCRPWVKGLYPCGWELSPTTLAMVSKNHWQILEGGSLALWDTSKGQGTSFMCLVNGFQVGKCTNVAPCTGRRCAQRDACRDYTCIYVKLKLRVMLPNSLGFVDFVPISLSALGLLHVSPQRDRCNSSYRFFLLNSSYRILPFPCFESFLRVLPIIFFLSSYSWMKKTL